MKFSITLIILFFMGCNSQSSNKSVSNLSSFEDSTSYSIGADLGANLKRQNVGIDYDVFLAGLIDGMELSEEDAKLNQKERREVMSLLQNRIRENEKNQGSGNLKLADEFLDKNKKDNSDIKETPTGLQYRVLKEGTGEMPKKTDRVKVHYVGRLMDGSKFDSSVDRGEPTEFGLNQVIKGWTEGLQLMKVGSKYEFFIHPNIAYGPRARPQIPANSLLIFEVELLEVFSQK
jgi:FKBP-type peptidyl-prolyl cis-trans isomerase